MDDATKNEAQVWLTKARRDLDSAKRLLQETLRSGIPRPVIASRPPKRRLRHS